MKVNGTENSKCDLTIRFLLVSVTKEKQVEENQNVWEYQFSKSRGCNMEFNQRKINIKRK